jgi:tetratricopeptide (TPR) repeat protein
VGWVDADDVVRGAEQIRSLAAAAPPQIGALHWPYVVATDAYGNPTCRLWRERLVRNDGSYRWQGRVHEVLTSPRPWGVLQCDEVVVEHHPPPRPEDHSRRNLHLLEQEYAACADDPPARLLFYLARELTDCGEHARALEMFREHLKRSTWGDERYHARLQSAALHQLLDDDEAAIDCLLQALKECPHWPDAYFALAGVYYQRGDWHKVLHWTEVGRAMPPPDTQLFANPMDYRFNWIVCYTNALYHLGAVQEALDWTRRALAICPGDARHRQNLAFFQRALRES